MSWNARKLHCQFNEQIFVLAKTALMQKNIEVITKRQNGEKIVEELEKFTRTNLGSNVFKRGGTY